MPKIKTANGIKDRKVVSRNEWIAARKKLLKAEKELTHRSDEIARQRQELPGFESISNIDSTSTREALRLPIFSAGARSCSSITSCSAPITPRAAHPAPPSPTDTTRSSLIWPIMM